MPIKIPLPLSMRRIYAVDIGTTLKKKAFAWAVTQPESEEVWADQCIENLVEAMAADLRQGVSVALGLEAPLFLPVPDSADDLSKGRPVDTNRSCFAPAGGYVATLALHQTAWVLRELRKACVTSCSLTLDPTRWYPREESPVLFCWETFVSTTAHARKDREDGHMADAATAARFFAKKEKTLQGESKVAAKNPISLIGAAALWSGWSTDLTLLSVPTVVLRPDRPYEGPVGVLSAASSGLER
jgi:hypothetical protein